MTNLKSEKGSITLFVIVSVMLIISFLISTHLILANKVKNQKEIIDQTRKIYESDKSADEIYNDFFDIGGVVPIYTEEQFLAIGSGEQFFINGKIYSFSSNKNYLLKNNLNIDTTEYDYIDWKSWVSPEQYVRYKDAQLSYDGNSIILAYSDGTEFEYNENRYYYIPDDYAQVDYIENTDKQWININYIPTIDTKVSITLSDVKFDSSGVSAPIISGTTKYSNTRRFLLAIWSNKFSWSGADASNGTVFGNNQYYNINTITLQQNIISFNEEVVSNEQISNFQDVTNISLYYSPYNANVYSKYRLYSFSIWESGGLQKKFIPCIRKADNKLGLYDIIDNEFYINQGTGEFGYGNLLNIENDFSLEYTEVKYIENTNKQWININYTPTINTKVSITLSDVDYYGNNSFPIISGTTNYANTRRFLLTIWQNKFSWSGRDANSGTVFGYNQYQNKNTITLQQNMISFNEDVISNEQISGFQNATSIYLFYSPYHPQSAYSYGKYKLYSFTIWENGNLVRDFIPCIRNSDQKPGLYDNVNGVFYTNNGTGEFSYESYD